MTKRINLRQAALLRFCWIVDADIRNQLDKFFLVKDDWEAVEADLTMDQEECKRYLKHDGQEYEVILVNPVRQLRGKEVGMSFRVNYAAGLRIVMIKEWETANNG